MWSTMLAREGGERRMREGRGILPKGKNREGRGREEHAWGFLTWGFNVILKSIGVYSVIMIEFRGASEIYPFENLKHVIACRDQVW